MFRGRLLLSISVVVLLLVFVGAVQANGNLATNGGFESGDLTYWSITSNVGNTTTVINDGTAKEGVYYEQTVLSAAGYAGPENLISFYGAGMLSASVWLRNSSDTAIAVEFGCDYGTTNGGAPWWYGQNIIQFSVPALTDWTLYSMVEGAEGNVVIARSGSGWPAGLEVVFDKYGRPTAASQAGYGNNMAMMVKVVNLTAGKALDADNLVVTPEPATIALLGLGGLALIRRKR